MQYCAKGSDFNRYVELFDEQDNLLGSLDYPKWYSSKAVITMANGDVYNITCSNGWTQSIQIVKNDAVIAELKFSWTMNITLNIGSNLYDIRRPFFKRNYTVLTGQDTEIAKVTPYFLFSKLSSDFDIEINDNYKEQVDSTIALFLIYCVNYMRLRHGKAS